MHRRAGGRWDGSARRTVAAASLALAMTAGLAATASASTGPTTHRAPAAAAPLPGPTAVGQSATISASISMSTAGGLGGPGGVDGSVALMLTTAATVTAVNTDGSYSRQTTIQSLNVVDAPAGADAQLGYDTLVGTAFDQQIDADGSPTSSSLGGGLSDEQQLLGQGILDAMNAMIVGFPAGPVTVGASWTSSGQVGQATLTVPVTYQCRLTSASDDSYTLEVSYSESVRSNALAGTVNGTISGSGTLAGSTSNPLVVSGTMYQTVDGVLTGSDGASSPVRGDLSITLTSSGG